MLCEICQKAYATAFSSEFAEGVQKEYYLCNECLKNKKLSSISKAEVQNQPQNHKLCICGTSFKEISETGYVKCKECYNTFEKEFETVIKSLHSSNVHRGKRKMTKLELLTEQLEKARENNFVSLAQKLEKEIDFLKGELNE